MSKDQLLYNEIGREFNSSRKADPYITGKLVELLSPKKEHEYVDIGCGTGNYTVRLAQIGVAMHGIDPSQEMLTNAREKSGSVVWRSGFAEKIPTPNQFFDGGIATLTIHHWTNLETAFAELFRVFKSGGRLVIFTSTPGQMTGYWLNHYFPGMMAESIRKMPGLIDIETAAGKAGFKLHVIEKYSIRFDLQDHFLYTGKLDPTRYLDEKIRMGISSFASLAHNEEVKEGLGKLKTDLMFNKFEMIKSKFENNSGDYLFIVIKKE